MKAPGIVGITGAMLVLGLAAAAFMVNNDTGTPSEQVNAVAPVDAAETGPRPAEAAIPLVKATPATADPENWHTILHDGLLANYARLSGQTQVDMCDGLSSLGSGKQVADYILSANDGSTSAALASLYVIPADLAGIPPGVPPLEVLELAGDAVIEFCRA